MTSISGLHIIPEYLTEMHEKRLLSLVDAQPWMHDLRRRVQHYGYCYDYRRRTIKKSMHLGDLPDWLLELAYRVQDDGFIREVPDQVIVNEYLPGMGIAAHVDCAPCFGGTILSFSLGSRCVMDFTHVHTGAEKSFLLEPRSLLILKDDARYDWKHGIAPRQTDFYNGEAIYRGRRISLTFRKVILS
ncbi:MAG: alpha-ketoglutarate-dependent dioxygenase AlkB [Anaerolineae bacterium]|nr:alpha-ketoglutarate-dependent dioxygenase AlkB [Anaerolineae bacterium]